MNGAASGGHDRPEPVAGTLAAATGMTLPVGLLITVMGLGHLYGVIVTATGRGYVYDFRLAALLLVGIALAFGVRYVSRRCVVSPGVNELPGAAH